MGTPGDADRLWLRGGGRPIQNKLSGHELEDLALRGELGKRCKQYVALAHTASTGVQHKAHPASTGAQHNAHTASTKRTFDRTVLVMFRRLNSQTVGRNRPSASRTQ